MLATIVDVREALTKKKTYMRWVTTEEGKDLPCFDTAVFPQLQKGQVDLELNDKGQITSAKFIGAATDQKPRYPANKSPEERDSSSARLL